MLINLMTVWKENILPDILSDQVKGIRVAQSSFQFEQPPRVVFVKDIHSPVEATCYGDLPTLPLQAVEYEIYEQTQAKLSKSSRFYNGKQMLLTAAVYDTSSNTLYLEAVRVDYVFLEALEEMKKLKAVDSVLQHKAFFTTGVLTPFISSDDRVSVVTRRDNWQLRSVTAGLLECQDEKHPLTDLIPYTAVKEADEEFVLDRRGHRRFDFVRLPAIASISFWEAMGLGRTPTMEFVTPIQIRQDGDFILSVMNNNEAAHAHEHVSGSAVNIPVDAQKRQIASDFMRQKFPGSFLYGPVLHACAVKQNRGMQFSARIPEITDSRFYPIGIFKPAPQKALSDQSALEDTLQLQKK